MLPKTMTILGNILHLNKKHFSMNALYKNRNEDDFEILSLLGKGSTSMVYLGYDILNNEKVTLKLIKKEILLEKIVKQIQINTLLQLDNCPNIVPLKGVIKNDGCGSFGLVFQHIPGIPLHIIMRQKELRTSLSTKQIYKIIYQMLQTLKVIHRNKIIYRDLKPANILYSAKNDDSQQFHNVFLFDFGLAIIDGQHKKNSRFGTKCYKPPQTVFFKNQYNQKVDIWVLGLIFAQLLSNKIPLLPYKSDAISMQQIINIGGYDEQFIPQQLKQHVRKPSTAPTLWIERLLENVDKQTIYVISKMLHTNPKQRPGAQDILKSTIFDSYLPL